MNRHERICLILSRWAESLPIDGQSGESIVTVENLDDLCADICAACSILGQWRSLRLILLRQAAVFREFIRYGFGKHRVSMNLFRPV